MRGQAGAGEVGAYGEGVGQRGDPLHACAAAGAFLGVSEEHSCEEGRPRQSGAAGWGVAGAGLGGGMGGDAGGGHDRGAVSGMRRQHAVVAYQVHAGG